MRTTTGTETRKGWMAELAKAPPDALAQALLATCPDLPPHTFLRAPEIGAVMVQGRTGGTGAPFNLGEMTVTRCTLRLGSGEVGHAVVQGRDTRHAAQAALVDALMQTDAAAQMLAGVLEPLAGMRAAARGERAAKAAATRVDFFTLVRGEA